MADSNPKIEPMGGGIKALCGPSVSAAPTCERWVPRSQSAASCPYKAGEGSPGDKGGAGQRRAGEGHGSGHRDDIDPRRNLPSSLISQRNDAQRAYMSSPRPYYEGQAELRRTQVSHRSAQRGPFPAPRGVIPGIELELTVLGSNQNAGEGSCPEAGVTEGRGKEDASLKRGSGGRRKRNMFFQYKIDTCSLKRQVYEIKCENLMLLVRHSLPISLPTSQNCSQF